MMCSHPTAFLSGVGLGHIVEEKVDRAWGYILAAVVAVASVVGIVIWRYVEVFSTNVVADNELWGQFGDYFGGVLNPILSFSAFIALLITFKHQLESSRDADIRHFEQQREQRFFNLLSLVAESAKGLRYTPVHFVGDENNRVYEGRIATEKMWRDFVKQVLDKAGGEVASDMHRYQLLKASYETWGKVVATYFEVYMHSVLVLLEYVARSTKYNDEFKNFSVGVLRAQMTESERLLLYYSSICNVKFAEHSMLLRFHGFGETALLSDPLAEWREKLHDCAMVSSYLKQQQKTAS